MSDQGGAAPGGAIGSVRVDHVLSRGAEGRIFVGTQPGLDRVVAIREQPTDGGTSAERLERLRREARLGGRVSHPNVVGVIDCFTRGGYDYLLLEYVDGPDLRHVLDASGRAPLPVATAIALEVSRGLEELHANEITHGGLRPERILLSRRGTPKIGGLGFARDAREAGGPPIPPSPYRAPELAAGLRPDSRTDVYGVGALLYELITGDLPCSGARLPVTTGAPRLSRLVAACLNEEPERRPSTAGELRRNLERLSRRPGVRECRRLVSGWLYASRVVRPSEATRDDPEIASRSLPDDGPGRVAPIHAEVASPSLFSPGALSASGAPPPPGVPSVTRPSADDPPALEQPARRIFEPRAGVRESLQEIGRGGLRDLLAGQGRLITAAAAGLMVALGAAFLLGPDAPSGPVGESGDVPAVSAGVLGGNDPAFVRFVVHPWAEIQVDESPAFLTPIASPLELAPGEHEIVLRHPRLGTVRRRVNLEPGEKRVVKEILGGEGAS